MVGAFVSTGSVSQRRRWQLLSLRVAGTGARGRRRSRVEVTGCRHGITGRGRTALVFVL